jgi:hypothetical protein
VRLLFDEQLSEDLCGLLRDEFPDSPRVRQLGSGALPRRKVWQISFFP